MRRLSCPASWLRHTSPFTYCVMATLSTAPPSRRANGGISLTHRARSMRSGTRHSIFTPVHRLSLGPLHPTPPGRPRVAVTARAEQEYTRSAGAGPQVLGRHRRVASRAGTHYLQIRSDVLQ